MFRDGGLLPLMKLLAKNDHITKVDFQYASMYDSRYRASGNGNSNARVLNFILKENKIIQELNLSGTGLDDDGMVEICEGMQHNRTITNLNLSGNHFGELGAERLRKALENNVNLKYLDMSRNALGFHSIEALVCSCAPRNIIIKTNGNFVLEEILNSVSHGVAFLFAVIGANLLIIEAADDIKYSAYHFWPCVLYSFSLLFLFLSSCLYHSFFMLPDSKFDMKTI